MSPLARRLARRHRGADRDQPKKKRQPRWEWLQAAGTLCTGVAVVVSIFALLSTNASNQAQHDLAEEGQVSERFSKSVEQLASDILGVRLGGIYGLERIMRAARSSDGDEPAVIGVLCAFVREKTSSHPSGVQPDPATVTPAIDVQAALTVISRRPYAAATGPLIDLAHAHLDGADLQGADLSHAQLAGSSLAHAALAHAILDQATLDYADLTLANLNQAHLIGTHLRGADLTRANLSQAHLDGAIASQAIAAYANLNDATATYATLSYIDLSHAQAGDISLTHAVLVRADLSGAQLLGAHLEHADLDHANISGTNLSTATLGTTNLTGVIHDQHTHLPAGTVLPP